jgi:hypothetical protein
MFFDGESHIGVKLGGLLQSGYFSRSVASGGEVATDGGIGTQKGDRSFVKGDA